MRCRCTVDCLYFLLSRNKQRCHLCTPTPSTYTFIAGKRPDSFCPHPYACCLCGRDNKRTPPREETANPPLSTSREKDTERDAFHFIRVLRPQGEFPCRGGSREPKVGVGASDSGRAFILRSLGVGGCSSPLTLAPTSIARQGDSASPAFPRFPCQTAAGTGPIPIGATLPPPPAMEPADSPLKAHAPAGSCGSARAGG